MDLHFSWLEFCSCCGGLPRPEAPPELRPGRLDGALEAANLNEPWAMGPSVTGGVDVTDVTDVLYASGHLDKFEAGGLPERLVRPSDLRFGHVSSLLSC